MSGYDIESFDYGGQQRVISDAKGIKFSNHYGADGSGYGYLKFDLERDIGVAHSDVGFGYRVKIRKGFKVIYDGMIREIGEATREGIGTISVSAVGYIIAAEDAPEILRNFCNVDLSKWEADQIPGSSFQPQNYATSSGEDGLILNATTQLVEANTYTELKFDFWPGEIAERLKCDVYMNLGNGVTFDGDVDYGVIFDGDVLSIDGPNKYVFYKNNSTDSVISVGMTLYNVTQDLSNVITAVDASLDRITVTTDPAAWNADDEIYIRNALFSATISSVASQVITYGSDTGEQNISNSSVLKNITRDEAAVVSSFDTALDTITVTGDISSWVGTDSIAIELAGIQSSTYLFYKNNSDETKIVSGMVVTNISKNISTTIDSVDTTLNRIKCTSSPSSWVVDDIMFVPGPLFTANVVSVAGSVITYTNETGEGNISTAYELVNLTKKDSSGISSNDTGADTITASGDVSSWALNDVIIIPAPLFQATVSTVSSTQITFTGEAGLRIVNSDTGWVLHNITEDAVATVASWTAPDKLDVAVAGEISTWTGDTVYIYTPYSVDLRDSNDDILWPSDWRLGAVSGLTSGINVTTTGSPTGLKVRFGSYMAGSGNERSFAKIESVKAYSTLSDITMETLAKAMLTDLAVLGIDSSESDIAAITKVIEPSVFEFKDIKEALTETAKFGSQNSSRVAWGLRLNDAKKFFVEEFPADIGYTLIKEGDRSDVEVTADLGESVQRLRGVYTNALGEQVIMDWLEDTTAYYGSYYVSRTESLSNIDNDTDAQAYLQLILGEDATPPIASSYTVRGEAVRDVYGNVIPFDEVVANGKYIEVEDFRAAITGSQVSDLSGNWVRDRLVAVEIDIDAETVKLTPGQARKTFEVYMAELSRIAGL